MCIIGNEDLLVQRLVQPIQKNPVNCSYVRKRAFDPIHMFITCQSNVPICDMCVITQRDVVWARVKFMSVFCKGIAVRKVLDLRYVPTCCECVISQHHMWAHVSGM